MESEYDCILFYTCVTYSKNKNNIKLYSEKLKDFKKNYHLPIFSLPVFQKPDWVTLCIFVSTDYKNFISHMKKQSPMNYKIIKLFLKFHCNLYVFYIFSY